MHYRLTIPTGGTTLTVISDDADQRASCQRKTMVHVATMISALGHQNINTEGMTPEVLSDATMARLDDYEDLLDAMEDIKEDAQELASENQRLKGEDKVRRDLLLLALPVIESAEGETQTECNMLVELESNIRAALNPAPTVQFMPADDTEGGAA